MCKLRFSSITKRDLTEVPTPAAAGQGTRKRKGQNATPRPEKVRVRRRDARFYDDPDDYLPHHRDELFRRHEPQLGASFLPFFGGRLSSLRELFGFSSPRSVSPPHFLPYNSSPPPAPPLPRNRRPLPIPIPPPAAVGPPILIDLTREEDAPPVRAPSQPVVIDLTGDSAVEVVDEADSKSVPTRTLPSRDRDYREREHFGFSPFRINITGGTPQIGIFNLSVPTSNEWERQSSSLSFDEW